MQIQVTNRYFRAIAKTGFHYFLTQFPNYSGHEAIFSDIREFITNDESELVAARINQFVGVHKKPIAPTAPVLAHLLCAEIRRVRASLILSRSSPPEADCELSLSISVQTPP